MVVEIKDLGVRSDTFHLQIVALLFAFVFEVRRIYIRADIEITV